MKFKVGQKVRNKRSVALDGGLLKIVKLDAYDKTCLCEGVKGTYWHYECDLEPFASFQEKLDRFMKEPVGFLVKSKEIADELAKVFERNGMKPRGGRSTKELMTVAFNEAKNYPGDVYVCCNVEGREGNLMCGTSDFTFEYERELLDVTLDELKEYLESTPQTLEKKLELFKAGAHALHTPTQEIYDKLMVELEKRGYRWQSPVSSDVSYRYWDDYKSNTIVHWGFFHNGTITYGKLGGSTNAGREVLELTPEDFKGNKQEEYMKITIETDGHYKTIAECNGITAESLCNPTDEFKLPKGVHMAVQRLLEKLKEPERDTVFHVGDIVEVVANEFWFRGDPIGLQGVVKDVDAKGANINIPIPGSPLYFYNRELKLIRRGNN